MSKLTEFIKSFDQKFLDISLFDKVLTLEIDRNKDVLLCFYFENIDTEFFENRNIEDGELIELIVAEEIQISKCSIKFGIEYEESKNTDILYPILYTKSIDDLKISVCRNYYQIFRELPKYLIGTPDDSYCSSDIEYKFFEILFSVNQEDYFFRFYQINQQELTFSNSGIQPIIFSTIDYSPGLTHIRDIPIVLTNTKTRRLGYLKVIIELFQESTYYPISLFPTIIERLADSFSPQLELYQSDLNGNNKGLIKSGFKGSSATPYIYLLKNLNLITEINKSYILTKQAKYYFEVNKYMNSGGKGSINIFLLQEYDCIFFLDTIIRNDIIYSGAVIQISKILGEEFNSKDIYPLLKSFLLNILEDLERKLAGDKRGKLLSVIINRVSLWQKEEKYAEHIVEPRINWFLDLKLISNSERKGFYKFTDAGNRFINVLSGIEEAFINGWLDNIKFLDSSYFSAFSYIYSVNIEEEINSNNIIAYLENSMVLFKTDAPKRIAASQGINYTCTMSLVKDRNVINFNQVKDYLLNNSNKLFSLDWFKTENDGSLNKQLS